MKLLKKIWNRIFIDGLIYAMIFKKTGNCVISTVAHILCNVSGFAFVFLFYVYFCIKMLIKSIFICFRFEFFYKDDKLFLMLRRIFSACQGLKFCLKGE